MQVIIIFDLFIHKLYYLEAILIHLKLRHLEVFVALIEAGSVSRAAQKLNLTQPAVSIALSNMEAEMGFRLFNRSKGFFVPSSEALLLQTEIEQGLFAISRIEQRVKEIRSGATGGVSIALNGVLAMNVLPQLIAEFQLEYPDVNVEMRIHSSRRIASWVSGQQIDIGIIDAPVPVVGLNAKLFYNECVCIMHKDDPLSKLKVIKPNDLENRSVVSITGDHLIDRQLEKTLFENNISIQRNFSSYYFAIARNMVSQGDKVAIVDCFNGKAELKDEVVWRPFSPKISNEIAMVTSSDQPLGKAAQEIHNRLHHFLEKESFLVEDKIQNKSSNK
ncbi:MAG: LysR family transcriptional regulator [Cocleimonas sp.]